MPVGHFSDLQTTKVSEFGYLEASGVQEFEWPFNLEVGGEDMARRGENAVRFFR